MALIFFLPLSFVVRIVEIQPAKDGGLFFSLFSGSSAASFLRLCRCNGVHHRYFRTGCCCRCLFGTVVVRGWWFGLSRCFFRLRLHLRDADLCIPLIGGVRFELHVVDHVGRILSGLEHGLDLG